MEELIVPSSQSTFRDPAGTLQVTSDGALRSVADAYAPDMLDFLETPLAAKLVAEGLLISSQVLRPHHAIRASPAPPPTRLLHLLPAEWPPPSGKPPRSSPSASALNSSPKAGSSKTQHHSTSSSRAPDPSSSTCSPSSVPTSPAHLVRLRPVRPHLPAAPLRLLAPRLAPASRHHPPRRLRARRDLRRSLLAAKTPPTRP